MESGLEGRNNADHEGSRFEALLVSMKSGLEGRNNPIRAIDGGNPTEPQ